MNDEHDRGFGRDVDESVIGSVTVDAGNATVAFGSVADLYFNSAGDGEADELVALGVRGSRRANVVDFKPMPRELHDDQRLVVAEDARTDASLPDCVADYFASPLSDGQFATSDTEGVSPVLPVAGERVELGDDAAWLVGGEGGAVAGDAGGALLVDDTALVVGVTDEVVESVRRSLDDDRTVVGHLTDETLTVEKPATRLLDAVDDESVEVDLADTRVDIALDGEGLEATVDHRESHGAAVVTADERGVEVRNSTERDETVERANVAGVDVVRSGSDGDEAAETVESNAR